MLAPKVVKEGRLAPFQNGAMLPSLEPKWGHTALPGGQYGPILPHGVKKEGEVFRMLQGGQSGYSILHFPHGVKKDSSVGILDLSLRLVSYGLRLFFCGLQSIGVVDMWT